MSPSHVMLIWLWSVTYHMEFDRNSGPSLEPLPELPHPSF